MVTSRRLDVELFPSFAFRVLTEHSIYAPPGWGKIKHPGNAHHTLQQAQMPPVPKDVCAKKLAASPGQYLRMNLTVPIS